MEKKSFKEIREEQQAAKHNSDLLNLATAYDRCTMQIQECLRQMQKVRELQNEITVMAASIESGDLIDYAAVKSLYDKTYFGKSL